MYEGYKICPKLTPKEKCFRVQKYASGKMIELLHEHIPSHRISLDSEIQALQALIGQFSNWSAEFNLYTHMNDRKGGPLRPTFTEKTVYSEEGVIRRYFASSDITAWSDTVILEKEFRCK